MGLPAIEVEHVSKRFKLYKEKPTTAKDRIIKLGRTPYETFQALDDVSFEVPEGETLGLLGHNGSGKSTLLKCVAGTLRPNSGHIRARGRMAALLELGAGFHPELTGRENVYLNGSILGFTKNDVDSIFDEVVEFAEVGDFIDLQVKHYSSGMYARLGFAVAVNVDPDVLLIDEVLSVGDEAFQRKCMERIRQFQREGRTILFVTHVADLLRQICERGAVLHHGRLLAVDEPGVAIRVFREALERGGIGLEEVGGGIDRDDETDAERNVTKDVRFTDIKIDYPATEGKYLEPNSPLKVVAGYEAKRRIDDIAFAINIHDVEGHLLLGANTDVLDTPVDFVEGSGEVVFDFASIPLLDGTYKITLGMHSHDGGIEYDHRDQLESFSVLNRARTVGLVALPLEITHKPQHLSPAARR
jgi:ABC-2 type transport system ATP-binding protein